MEACPYVTKSGQRCSRGINHPGPHRAVSGRLEVVEAGPCQSEGVPERRNKEFVTFMVQGAFFVGFCCGVALCIVIAYFWFCLS